MSSYASKKPSYLDDYVNVNVRVALFYERFPNGRITTSYQIVDDLIIFQAQVYRQPDDAMPSSTGTAMDKIDINQSTTEKAETASVGRALALLGFEVKKSLASREEMDKYESRQPLREATKLAPSPNRQTEACATESVTTTKKPDTRTMAHIRELRTKLKITTPVDFSKITHAEAESLLADLIAKSQE